MLVLLGKILNVLLLVVVLVYLNRVQLLLLNHITMLQQLGILLVIILKHVVQLLLVENQEYHFRVVMLQPWEIFLDQMGKDHTLLPLGI